MLATHDAAEDGHRRAVPADAGDPQALRSVDAHACKSVIVAIGENFEAAVLCVAALKEIGVGHIIARAISDRQARILTAVGASEVIEIEAEMGKTLGKRLISGNPAGVAVASAVAKR